MLLQVNITKCVTPLHSRKTLGKVYYRKEKQIIETIIAKYD